MKNKRYMVWIPVSERLPEDYETVLATVEEYYGKKEYFVYPESRYSKRHGWEWAFEAGCDYWKRLDGVVAWMPLPLPYKASPTGEEVEE